jgi:hypothetical protein
MVQARSDLLAELRSTGYALLTPELARAALQIDPGALARLTPSWEQLPRDTYLLDAGRYRSRRHSCFIESLPGATLESVPRRAHWQPTAYNALHGGLQRWFEPIDAQVLDAPAWQQLIASVGEVFATLRPVSRWYIEAHQFRIDTSAGLGRPTPEGAHRDGVDFVAVVLVQRRGVRGGETRVFEAHGSAGVRFTMQQPWSMLLMDDARVVHETTPIQGEAGVGIRDTLVLTYREHGFQEPAEG